MISMKNIMKRAWEMMKEVNEALFSECLKEAWKESREIKEVYIKDWFINRIELGYGKRAFNDQLCRIIKETEKAYLLDVEWFTVDGEYDGSTYKWVPKSCTLTMKEHADIEERQEKAFEDGCRRYENLINFAKNNNVKGVRIGLRKETILKKIKDAGLEYAI